MGLVRPGGLLVDNLGAVVRRGGTSAPGGPTLHEHPVPASRSGQDSYVSKGGPLGGSGGLKGRPWRGGSQLLHRVALDLLRFPSAGLHTPYAAAGIGFDQQQISMRTLPGIRLSGDDVTVVRGLHHGTAPVAVAPPIPVD
ncbi:MAG: hypothetical protein QGH65_19125, partial [SAR324 cluster bacterium]|nr:hypothetical protein [SAR324 cluster bacterium]